MTDTAATVVEWQVRAAVVSAMLVTPEQAIGDAMAYVAEGRRLEAERATVCEHCDRAIYLGENVPGWFHVDGRWARCDGKPGYDASATRATPRSRP